MPSQYTKSFSLGSDDEVGGKREKLYMSAARQRTDGNLSRLICQVMDRELGIDLPLPEIGRRKLKSKGTSDGLKTKRRQSQ